MPGRKEVRGGAGILTLAANISNAVGTLQATGSVAGWPTGAAYPFVIKIDPQGAEEKCLCSSLAGASPATINIIQRGYDGTSAQAHNSGVPIQHCVDADSLDTMFDHVFSGARDDHAQYIRTDGTRGFTGVSAIAGTPVAVGTAQAPGSALTLARSDHVHGLGPLVIPTSALQDGAVTSVKIADGTIVSGDIANGAIGNPKIAANGVQNVNIGAGAVQSNSILGGAVRPHHMSMAVQAMVVDLTPAATAGAGRRVLGTINIPVQGEMYQLCVGAMYCGNNSVANDTYLMDIDIYDGTNHYGAGSVTIRHGAIGQDMAYVIPPTYVAPATLSYALTITVGIARQTGTGVLNISGGGPWRMTALLFPTETYP